MYMHVFPAYISVYHVCQVPVEVTRTLDSLELELQVIESCHVHTRN